MGPVQLSERVSIHMDGQWFADIAKVVPCKCTRNWRIFPLRKS